MIAEEESISDAAKSLFLRAKTQNALKLVKEEYFLDKMPKSSAHLMKSPSDSNSTNSTCGDEENKD